MEYLNQPYDPHTNRALARHQEPMQAPAYPGVVDRADESDSAIMEYLGMLRRHRVVISLFALAGVALGIAVTAIQAPVYRATTSLEVLNLNEDFMNLKQSNPVNDTDSSYDTSEVQTQVKIMQ